MCNVTLLNIESLEIAWYLNALIKYCWSPFWSQNCPVPVVIASVMRNSCPAHTLYEHQQIIVCASAKAGRAKIQNDKTSQWASALYHHAT